MEVWNITFWFWFYLARLEELQLCAPSKELLSIFFIVLFQLEEFLPIYSQAKKDKDQGCYEDFLECLKLYDKAENGLMLGAELTHTLLALGQYVTFIFYFLFTTILILMYYDDSIVMATRLFTFYLVYWPMFISGLRYGDIDISTMKQQEIMIILVHV